MGVVAAGDGDCATLASLSRLLDDADLSSSGEQAAVERTELTVENFVLFRQRLQLDRIVFECAKVGSACSQHRHYLTGLLLQVLRASHLPREQRRIRDMRLGALWGGMLVEALC